VEKSGKDSESAGFTILAVAHRNFANSRGKGIEVKGLGHQSYRRSEWAGRHGGRAQVGNGDGEPRSITGLDHLDN